MDDDTVVDFTQVDSAQNADVFVRYLDAVAANPANQALKARTFALLDVALGAHLLDVGCGTGDDARTLYHLVGPSGRVVGIDLSEKLVGVARHRSAYFGLPVEFQVGDIYALAFPDASFDGCRAERVFVHLTNPDKAMAELARVTKPGGRVVVMDADWETLLVWPADRGLTRRLLCQVDASVPNYWAGRRLRSQFVRAGLVDVQVEPTTITYRTFAQAIATIPLPDFAERARAAGAISAAEKDEWLGRLQAGSACGEFFAALTQFVVSGRKPG